MQAERTGHGEMQFSQHCISTLLSKLFFDFFLKIVFRFFFRRALKKLFFLMGGRNTLRSTSGVNEYRGNYNE